MKLGTSVGEGALLKFRSGDISENYAGGRHLGKMAHENGFMPISH